MLCPEVLNFKAPESSITCQKFSANENSPLSTVHNFLYNHLVSVVLPDTFKVPESLTKALSNDCDYYKLNGVKLSEFVAKDFLHNFVKSGNLYVLSADSRIDCDNCLAVTPAGLLILNIDKCTYQSLGLEGSLSHFHTRTRERYVVTVDLKAISFQPGKRNYERTKTALEKLRLNVIVTWEPPTQDICPSSVAKYFHDLNYETKLCEAKLHTHTVYSSKVPNVQDCSPEDVVEWLGMISLEADTNGSPDCYTNTYETPEPNRDVPHVKFLQFRGFFTASKVVELYNRLRTFQADNDKEFVAMYVQGFSDSPVAWRGQEHHYYTNGDNSYVFIIKRGVCSCVQKCSQKHYRNKTKRNGL